MKMHALSGGRLRVRKSVYDADADRGATMELPVSAFLLRHPQGNVLFDAGYHPAAAEDAAARWGGMARIMAPIAAADDTVVDNLRDVGVGPEDVDLVICSHLHSDHCGCTAFFTRATLLCHASELAAARAPDSDRSGYVRDDWDQPLPLQEIDAEHDVFGDNRIVVVPLPGHTPGTVAAHVELDRSGSFLLASDAVSFRDNLEQGTVPRNTWNVEEATRSLALVRRIAADGATVLFGHDDAQWSTLKKGADAYE
ncbi:N-acyl homoserine lactonase family protein [Microbaculum marinum]|uniref:N-acyl homoserine lactonase family protein n=1 Tax=Microbaculum marinum TaxID=1764581 RepID=A0AAW9S3T8_9HYPH